MNCRILVVDDDRTIRNAIAEYLNNLGYQTNTAKDAKAAVARMKTARYYIVVMEVSLPIYSGGYSGWYLLNHIHNRYPLTKVIVVTGDASIETGLEAIRLGAICWITKPFSLLNLKNRISAIFRSDKVRMLPKRPKHDRLNC